MSDVKPAAPEGTGRFRQRARTRRAIVEAAAGLLAGGEPSVGEVAEAAGVSRRTVYLYFPSLEHLLADAALESARGLVEPELELATDPVERLDALVRAMARNSEATEDLGRTIIRHTVGTRPEEADPPVPRRGYRRVQWIEMALEPVRTTLAPADYERLVSQICLLIGWESMILLRDIRGLTAAEAEEVLAHAATALLAASLAK